MENSSDKSFPIKIPIEYHDFIAGAVGGTLRNVLLVNTFVLTTVSYRNFLSVSYLL